MSEIDFQSYYSVKDSPGIAWYLKGYAKDYQEVVIDQYEFCPGHPAIDSGVYDAAIGELVYCEPGCETEIETDIEEVFDNSRVIAVMVGDNREHEIDVDDLVKIDEDDFCGSCGQIGCGHDGR